MSYLFKPIDTSNPFYKELQQEFLATLSDPEETALKTNKWEGTAYAVSSFTAIRGAFQSLISSALLHLTCVGTKYFGKNISAHDLSKEKSKLLGDVKTEFKKCENNIQLFKTYIKVRELLKDPHFHKETKEGKIVDPTLIKLCFQLYLLTMCQRVHNYSTDLTLQKALVVHYQVYQSCGLTESVAMTNLREDLRETLQLKILSKPTSTERQLLRKPEKVYQLFLSV